jgi:hypothetical protein
MGGKRGAPLSSPPPPVRGKGMSLFGAPALICPPGRGICSAAPELFIDGDGIALDASPMPAGAAEKFRGRGMLSEGEVEGSRVM